METVNETNVTNDVNEKNLGYEVIKLGFQVNRKANNVLNDKTDKEVFDLDATSLTFTPSEVEMLVGEEKVFGGYEVRVGSEKDYVMEVNPSISNLPSLVWESSDSDIATVNVDGTILAKKVGEVVITATNVEDATIKADLTVSVVNKYTVKHKLTLEVAEGNGTVEGAGEYAETSSVEIKAIPSEGFSFVKWSDDNTDAQRTVIIGTEDITLAAYFAEVVPPPVDEKTPGEEGAA